VPPLFCPLLPIDCTEKFNFMLHKWLFLCDMKNIRSVPYASVEFIKKKNFLLFTSVMWNYIDGKCVRVHELQILMVRFSLWLQLSCGNFVRIFKVCTSILIIITHLNSLESEHIRNVHKFSTWPINDKFFNFSPKQIHYFSR
jgi:hypothetical protein